MASVYTPPQTTVTEISTPSITPLLASAANICIVGVPGLPASSLAQLTTTDTVLLQQGVPVVLPTLAALNNDASLVGGPNGGNVVVTDVLNPSYGTPLGAGYVQGTDFTVAVGEGPPDGTSGTITALNTGAIANGTLVQVTYVYVPSDYWNPIRLFTISDVEARFGPSFQAATNPQTGQVYYTGIGSQLSMAARLAFNNGAASVICQPLFNLSSNVPVAVNSGNVGTTAPWSVTLAGLQQYEDINVIVPIVDSSTSASNVLSIFGQVQSFLSGMNAQQQYMMAIFGEDGTSSTSTFQSLISTLPNVHAPSLQANFGNVLSCQSVLLNNTVFQLPTPGGYTNTINVGGQYAAAAVAGALASRPVASALTHAPIIGFSSVTDPRTPAQKNNDAGAGLFVIEQTQGLIRCRQSLTLDTVDGPAKSEISVVRAKFLMMESIKQTIDNQIIGQIIADGNSPMVVASAISGVLTLLQSAGAIVAYGTVNAALTSLNPTIITANFAYRPSFPVDYVNVTFSLDLTNSTVSATNTTTTNSGV
jgi:hypothetical protein